MNEKRCDNGCVNSISKRKHYSLTEYRCKKLPEEKNRVYITKIRVLGCCSFESESKHNE